MTALPFVFRPSAVAPLPPWMLPDIPALEELKSRRQWVAWKYVDRGGEKPTKVPVCPRTGFNASSSDPGTWGTYEEAAKRVETSGLAGVGYVLTEDDDVTGGDMDGCRDPETGFLDEWASDVVALAETYFEVSPSGRGLRSIWRGKIDKTIKLDAAHVELYRSLRYLTITGNHVEGTPDEIRPAPRTEAALRARVEAFKAKAEAERPKINGNGAHHGVVEVARVGGGGGGSGSVGGGGDSDNPFRDLNTAALESLEVWVPALFGPAARRQASGAWRIRSKDLRRDREEDLSIHRDGIKDWGEHDMGDPRVGSRSPIDLAMEYGGHGSPREAAIWLCGRLGRVPSSFGFRDDAELLRFGAERARELEASVRIDPETGEITNTGTAEERFIDPTPFVWQDPHTIPRRDWIYGNHYIRKFLSLTVAPGGVGKSSLSMAEALAMATCEDFLGPYTAQYFNVWLWNGEDPIDEMQRRLTAAIIHYGLDPELVQQRLFMNSGRNTEIVIASENKKTGTVIHDPVIRGVIAGIRRRKIDVMIVDPFLSSHSVSENDNQAINMITKKWSMIAEETNCSIELVHHVRKSNGNEISVDDGRGASSLLAAARSARVLNPMSDEEQRSCGVKNRRGYFRMDNGKANLAPPPDGSFWFQLIGVPLRNGPLKTDGDNVAVVAPWKWPSPLRGTGQDDVTIIQEAVSAEVNCRADPRSPDWVGNIVAKVLDIDISQPEERDRVKGMVRAWVESEVLKIVIRPDEKRRPREFVEVGIKVCSS